MFFLFEWVICYNCVSCTSHRVLTVTTTSLDLLYAGGQYDANALSATLHRINDDDDYGFANRANPPRAH